MLLLVGELGFNVDGVLVWPRIGPPDVVIVFQSMLVSFLLLPSVSGVIFSIQVIVPSIGLKFLVLPWVVSALATVFELLELLEPLELLKVRLEGVQILSFQAPKGFHNAALKRPVVVVGAFLDALHFTFILHPVLCVRIVGRVGEVLDQLVHSWTVLGI